MIQTVDNFCLQDLSALYACEIENSFPFLLYTDLIEMDDFLNKDESIIECWSNSSMELKRPFRGN